MDINDLGKLVEEKHKETQKQIGVLNTKVDILGENQIAIKTKLDDNVTTRVSCLQAQQKCKDEVHAAIRRVSLWNKLGASLAAFASAVAGYLLLKGKN